MTEEKEARPLLDRKHVIMAQSGKRGLSFVCNGDENIFCCRDHVMLEN